MQTVLGRLPDLQELSAAGITPTGELFDLRGDRWEPIGVPWAEVQRLSRALENIPSSGKKSELGQKSRAREKSPSLGKKSELGKKVRARTKTPSSDKFATDEKTAQLSDGQEKAQELEQHTDIAGNGATQGTTDCSPPLDPPIYNIYNKKEEFIGGGEGGGGARIWLADYVFETRDKGGRVLSQEEMRQLVQAHGIEAVKRELPRASMWLGANPRRRKASSGLLLFLSGWIRRTVPPEGEKRLPVKSWSAGRGEAQKSWRVGM